MIEESIKMMAFDHPHVLNLIGICVDGGPSPYIVMPFMANGSLLSYLKNHRADLVLPEDANYEKVRGYEQGEKASYKWFVISVSREENNSTAYTMLCS